MRQGEDEHGHPQMAPVVEQRQEARIEPAERSDRQDHVQQQEGAGAEGADQHGLGGGVGMEREADADEDPQVDDDAGDHHPVVDLLLPVPADGLVGDAHGALLMAGTAPLATTS